MVKNFLAIWTHNACAHRHVHIIFDVNVFAILRHFSYHDELPHDIDSHGMDADAFQSTMAQGFDSGHADKPISIVLICASSGSKQ